MKDIRALKLDNEFAVKLIGTSNLEALFADYFLYIFIKMME